jgi:hypothetical protein
MTYRSLAAAPFVLVALAAVAVVLAPPEARAALTQGEVDGAKALACVGLAVAALAFERGDYLRRGWGALAINYALLLPRDAVLLMSGRASPLAIEIVRLVVITCANVFGVLGAWTLARAWSVAGLEHPGTKGARRVLVGLAILASVGLAGPWLYENVRDVAFGASQHFDEIPAALGDMLLLPVVAPVALTALAVRDGTLRWPWTLLTTSFVAWLLYDAVYSIPDYVHLPSGSFHLASEQFHVLAVLCSGAAGLTQRKAVTDDDDELSSPP